MSAPEAEFEEVQLTAYALDEMDAHQRVAFEQRLAESAELRQELKELETLATALRTELSTESMPQLTASQRTHVQLSAANEVASAAAEPVALKSPVATRRPTIRRWAILGAEIAAGCAFVGAFTYFAWPNMRLSEPVAVVPVLTAPSASLKQPVHGDSSGKNSGYAVHFTNSSSMAAIDPLSIQDAEAKYPSGAVATDPKKIGDEIAPGVQELPKLEHPAPTDPIATVRLRLAKDRSEALGVKLNESLEQAAPEVTGLARLDSRSKQAVGSGTDHSFRYIRPSEEKPGERPNSGEAYQAVVENPFVTPAQQPLSTFSIDVDTASYANIRRFFTQGQMPPVDAVRIEEMINAFTYDYPRPQAGEPFSVIADAAPCLWQRGHYLARIALQARTFDKARRPPTNLVFLLDVSGSMQAANKLPLVKQAMLMLAEELNDRDRIAIVTYAGDAGVKLASTPGHDQTRIMQAIEALQAGGSTNGAAGINLAYEEAVRHFSDEGENRVILCTDGDFNVGVSDDDQLVKLITEQARTKVFLSVFGFGMGNLKDAKLEKLADKGNGHYGYIDDMREARRVFSEELVGTLYTVAKDVKIQLEFNPLTVGAYRLIGYENRALAARDFNDDTKDAGEIGAGHTVTALYEIVPRGLWPKSAEIEPLKYNATTKPTPAPVAQPENLPAEAADDLFTVKLRYKLPTAEASVKTLDYVVDDIAGKNVASTSDAKWAAAVAAFGMHLRQSSFKGTWSLDDIYEAAQSAKGPDANGRRQEFLDLIQTAKRLSPKGTLDIGN